MKKVPPDYVVSMLEGLTTLCHYILLDNVSPVAIGQPAPTATNISTETASAGQILTNLIHVFNPVTSGKVSLFLCPFSKSFFCLNSIQIII